MVNNGPAVLELLSAVCDGDDSAFEKLNALYEPLEQMCVSRCLRKMSVPVEREEMLQEARYALYRAALSYDRTKENPTFGLYAKICIDHILISHFLRRHSKPTCSLEQLRENGMWEPATSLSGDDILDNMIESESFHALSELMKQRLSPFEMSVCELRAQAWTSDRIAKQLGCNRKSVENALFRAAKKMR